MIQVVEKNNKNKSYKLFLKEMGARMRECRKKQGITQEQVAQKLGLAFVSYNSIERGVMGTTIQTLFNIANALSVSPAWLLLGKEEILFNKKEIIDLYIKGNV